MAASDNEAVVGMHAIPSIDPYGHAALILIESLMHRLIEQSVMSNDEAMDVVETALAVQADIAAIADRSAPAMWRSHTLLSVIAASLKTAGPS